jgi:hypothetical protein
MLKTDAVWERVREFTTKFLDNGEEVELNIIEEYIPDEETIDLN